ncbi:PIN domain-containing protein [Xanthobacteraceae bacterium A53D]
MIGVDTNVLLRVFIEGDDPRQHVRSVALFREIAPEPALLHPIVLAEATWTLTKRMKRPKGEVVTFIANVLDAEVFEIPYAPAARRALSAYEVGKADYADYLMGEMNADAGCRTTFTFDTDASAHPRYTLLS